MDWQQTVLFLAASAALLGSPGPAIAALLAVGRATGWQGGMRFYLGLQVGLASAALLTALGLFSLVSSYPPALRVMSIVATAYLFFLAWKIGSAPIGQPEGGSSVPASAASGFVVGVTNPKAYLAFASLFGSFALHSQNTADTGLKLLGVVGVMVIVDFAWLALGVTIGRLKLRPNYERAFNLVMGGMVAGAAGLALAS